MYHIKKSAVLCGTVLTAVCLLNACNYKNVQTTNTEQSSLTETDSTVLPIEPAEEHNLPFITEEDYSSYFNGLNGSAVFYTPTTNCYKIYNQTDANERRSPCSTFKIISSLAALENDIITPQDSTRKWSGEQFWNEDWNHDMELNEGFKNSCVWYFRTLTNEIGKEKIQFLLDELDYGNRDISDWEGLSNTNNSNRSLTGFWIESSLKISPKEQVEVLAEIFETPSQYADENITILKEIMTMEQDETEITIWGKTGSGKLGNTSLDAWFIGMFENKSANTYFAIHLSKADAAKASSALAKKIAIQIIADNFNYQ